MNKIIFFTLIAAALLVGAGCPDVTTQTPSASAPPAAGVTGGTAHRIDLHGRGLTKVSMDIFDRTDTQELDLSDNSLKDSLPSQLGQLTGLRVLDISGNVMTGLPAEVGRLSKLEVLDVSNNRLTGLPLEIGNLRNLKVLDVSGNQYSAQDLDSIVSGLPATTEVRR
ncbi:MAG: hypothetical protein RL272_942 [Candidatus Parcubacteria bacterium]|jgi:Leucine-rich repeat (LRR) protein